METSAKFKAFISHSLLEGRVSNFQSLLIYFFLRKRGHVDGKDGTVRTSAFYLPSAVSLPVSKRSHLFPVSDFCWGETQFERGSVRRRSGHSEANEYKSESQMTCFYLCLKAYESEGHLNWLFRDHLKSEASVQKFSNPCLDVCWLDQWWTGFVLGCCGVVVSTFLFCQGSGVHHLQLAANWWHSRCKIVMEPVTVSANLCPVKHILL